MIQRAVVPRTLPLTVSSPSAIRSFIDSPHVISTNSSTWPWPSSVKWELTDDPTGPGSFRVLRCYDADLHAPAGIPGRGEAD